MITLATLSDQMVEGKRRAAGRQLRKIEAICIDNYNIVLAEGSDPAKLIGQKFFANFTHLAEYLETPDDEIRQKMSKFFAEFYEQPYEDLTWMEMDKRFKVSEREKDGAKLSLYLKLKEQGREDSVC